MWSAVDYIERAGEVDQCELYRRERERESWDVYTETQGVVYYSSDRSAASSSTWLPVVFFSEPS